MVPMIIRGEPFVVNVKAEESLPETEEEFGRLLARAEAGEARAQYLVGSYFRAEADEIVAALQESIMTGSRAMRAPCGIWETDCFGDRVKEEHEKAFLWFEKAAAQGYPDAIYALSECYTRGMGTAVYPEKGHALLLEAAEKGCLFAEYDVAMEYYSGKQEDAGQVPVKQDFPKAVFWLKRAAAQGDALALYFLARCLEEGTGIEKNAEEAFPVYRLAAELGNPWAQCALGRCLEEGVGTPKDPEQALEWYRRAADGGDAEAWDALDRLS